MNLTEDQKVLFLLKNKNGENNNQNDMLNELDDAIRTGVWTDEASNQLDNLIQEYNNGRNEITQILGRSLSEKNRSSEAYAAASIIVGRSQSTMSERSGMSIVTKFAEKI